MRRKHIKLNNQGSTLLTVIICIAFIGILGSMMLSVTMTNLQMKIIESKSKENFYSCEVAMEEIRTGIEEIAATKIQEVYETKVLGNYADFLLNQPTALEKNTYIKQQICAAIIKYIGKINSESDAQLWSGTAVKESSDDIFNNYLAGEVGLARSDREHQIALAHYGTQTFGRLCDAFDRFAITAGRLSQHLRRYLSVVGLTGRVDRRKDHVIRPAELFREIVKKRLCAAVGVGLEDSYDAVIPHAFGGV
jgi:type II secretory pathway pseudopilin PulG